MLENSLAVSYCTLASGTRVTKWAGVPSKFDMAWGIGRICRWNGTGDHWYSLMQHTFVVCDLVPGHVKIFALLHDAAPECVGNDVPKPVKNSITSTMEDGFFIRTCESLGIGLPTEGEMEIVKAADIKAAVAEAWVIGNAGHKETYRVRDWPTEALTQLYREKYSVDDLLNRQGRAAADFLCRFDYWLQKRKEFTAACARTWAAL